MMFDLVWIVHPSIEVAFQLGIPLVTMPFLVNLDPAETSQRQGWLRRHIFFFFLRGRDEVRFCMLRKTFVFFCFWDIKIYETSTWDLGRFGDLDLFSVCGSDPVWCTKRGPMPRAWVDTQPMWLWWGHSTQMWLFLDKSRNYWVFYLGMVATQTFFRNFHPDFFGEIRSNFWRLRIFFTWLVQLNHQPEESLLPSKWFNF